jgi:DNA repair ATPase RecN
MSQNKGVSMVDLLCYIRDRLVEVHDSDDQQKQLSKLLYTLTLLDEFAASSNDTTYVAIIEDLMYAAQHMFIADHKVHIPTVEEIRNIDI